MNPCTKTSRLGVLVAASAAMLAFGMTAPAMAGPADGSVGHVPDKVPGGQTANGDGDTNKGWECDGNKGVGEGNPAHANSCPSSSVSPPVDSGALDFN
jgi:hypothetical protein